LAAVEVAPSPKVHEREAIEPSLSVELSVKFATSALVVKLKFATGGVLVGEVTVTEIELGNAQLRDAMRLKLQFFETSTGEGLAFIAMAIEHEQGEGLKRVFDLSRVT
jgi:hypothetical protein